MDNVEAIKSKLDIVELINGYIPVKKAGKNYKASCPFHSEKTPSFMISPEIQRYRCFGCEKSGDIFNFIMELEGIDFGEALKLLADKAGIELKYESSARSKEEKSRKQKIIEMNNLASKFYSHLLLKHKYGKKARKYLKDRGVKISTIVEFKLGYAPKSWNSLCKLLLSKKYTNEEIVTSGLGRYKRDSKGIFDMFRGRLVFSLSDHMDRIIGFSGRVLDKDDEPKYINTAETAVFRKENFLYGLNVAKSSIKQKNQAIVVEGEFDMISPHQAGIKNIVASKGTALTSNQAKLIKRYSDNVVLIFDSDKAGIEASIRGTQLIHQCGLNIKVAPLSKEFKDPDDVVKKDPKLLESFIRDAVPLWDYYFLYATEKFDMEQIYQKKKASDFLLDKIAQIEDKVVQSEYIKKFATVFDVSEPVVIEQMSKVGTEPKLSRGIKSVELMDAMKIVKGNGLSEYPAIEVYLLSLLTKVSEGKLKLYIKTLESDYFVNEGLRELFVKLKKSIKADKRLDIKVFYDRLRNSQGKTHSLFERIYLLDLQDRLLDSDLLDVEITSAIYRLKKSFLKRKLKKLTQKIKKAEASSDITKLKKLQVEVQKVSQALTAIPD